MAPTPGEAQPAQNEAFVNWERVLSLMPGRLNGDAENDLSTTVSSHADADQLLAAWEPPRGVLLTFADARIEAAFQCFVFSGRVLSGVLACVAAATFAFVLAMYNDAPAWVIAVNVIGLVLCLVNGGIAVTAAIRRNSDFFSSNTELALPHDIPTLESAGAFHASADVDPLAEHAVRVNIPTKGQLLLARIEEFGLSFNFSLVLVVQASCCYVKYAGCVADGNPGESCFNFVDAYIFAVLEAYCVIAPARFALVFPACVGAILLFAVSYVWSTPYVDVQPVTHAQRLLIEILVAAVNITSCYVRESSIRSAFVQKLRGDGRLSVVKQRRDEVGQLLLRMLPAETLASLGTNEDGENSNRVFFRSASCAVFRSDVVNFTRWSNSRTARRVVEMLSQLTDAFDTAAATAGVTKVKTIGDAYWTVAGLPTEVPDPAHRVVKFAALALDHVMECFSAPDMPEGVRIGVGSGAGHCAVVGLTQVSFEVFGEANDVADALEKAAAANSIFICENTFGLLEMDPHLPSAIRATFLEQNDITVGTNKRVRAFKVCRSAFSDDGGDAAVANKDAPRDVKRTPIAPVAVSVEAALPQYSNQRLVEDAMSDVARLQKDDKGEAKLLPVLSSIVFGYDDKALEQRFNSDGVLLERLPFRVCAIQLSVALVMLAIYMTVTDGISSSGRTGSSGPVVMLWCSFAVSLALPIGLFWVPPRTSFGVAAALAVYYISGAVAIIGAGTSSAFYVTRNVFFLRMVFAVLKGSVVSIPAVWGVVHDLFPTIAYTATLFWPPSPLRALPRGDRLVIEYTIWIVASYFVGFLCRISNEMSNRRNFLVTKNASLLTLAVNGQAEVSTRLMDRVVPVQFSADVLDWFSAAFLRRESASTRFDRSRLNSRANSFALVRSPLTPQSPLEPLHDVRSQEANGGSPRLDRDVLCYDIHQAAVAFVKVHPRRIGGPDHDEDTTHVILEALDIIEEFLSTEDRLLKIKTVADTMLIVALPDLYYPAGAVKAVFGRRVHSDRLNSLFGFLLHLQQRINRKQRDTDITAGLHVGPLVGAVLGAERITFDVLGDTVNTSSRLASTGTHGRVSLSTAAFELLFKESPSAFAMRSSSASATPSVREMKGKGSVPVYDIGLSDVTTVSEQSDELEAAQLRSPVAVSGADSAFSRQRAG